MAVCSHTRVHIYDTNSMKVKKNLTTFYYNCFVCNNSLMTNQMVAASSQNGIVQLFDINKSFYLTYI
eukprot:UN00836